MLTTIGNTMVAIARNWMMLIALLIVSAFAMSYQAEREWLSFAGLAAIVVGIGANFFVMIINGGRMPVRTENESWLENTNDHQLMHGETRLAILGDWIGFHHWLLSPGDICLCAGLPTFLVSLLFD